MKMLKRHLMTDHGISPAEYRKRWDLPADYPMVASSYSERRRELAKTIGLGRKPGTKVGRRKKVAAAPTDGQAVAALNAAEGNLSGALGRFMMLTESYPQLTGDSVMRGLSEELSSTENKIAFARQAFNDAVLTYNNAREVFPANVVAGMFHFQAAAAIEITAVAEREAPKLKFA